MKTKNLIIAIILLLNVAAIQAQNSLYDKLSNNKSITTVYISKALMGMMPNMDMNGMNVKNLADKMEQIEIYTTENKEAGDLMKSELKALLQNKVYEILMSVKEDGENVSFYGQKENDKFKDLVMLVDEPSECVLMRFKGNFTTEDIQQVLNKNKK